ncbi:hypothetical protein JMJ06_000203 [Enterococcus faecalis]|nr:hypothetical protein [Enterococcus faecalis]
MLFDETAPTKQSKKKRAKKVPKIPNSILKKMNHLAIEDEHCIRTREGFTDYLILENNAIRRETQENQRMALGEFVNLFKAVTSDMKLIFMGYAADTSKQIEYIQKRSAHVVNGYVQQQRSHKIWELTKAHVSILEDIVYIQIFGDTREHLERARTELLNVNGQFIHVHSIPIHQKKQIMYQLYNLGERAPVFDDSINLKEERNKLKEDRAFMSSIMPETGITHRYDWFGKTGRGYSGVYHLHRYAKKERFFWGETVFRQSGVITTVDVSQIESRAIKSRLNKQIGEEEDNSMKGANREIRMQAALEKQLLEQLLEDMLSSNESVKEVTVRYYISGKTKQEVRQIAETIDDQLSFRGYKASFLLGEEEMEWRALFSSQTAQKKRKNRRGKELTTTDLGTSYPLNHSQLIDPNGLYFGNTNTGGLTILDTWHKDAQRLSYNFGLFGLPGSGKSSTLKKIGSHNHILGNYTYYFMANAENDRFMDAYNGLSLDASGKDGSPNPFQIFATIIDELTGEVDEQGSYTVTLNKLKIIYQNMYGTIDHELVNSLEKYLDEFFQQWFVSHNMDRAKITQYEYNQYPLLEDFDRFIKRLLYDSEKKIHSSLSSFEAERLDKINETNETMLRSYSQIFNRHTSIQFDAYLSVSFNLSSLLNSGKNVFNAQFYNLLFMVWNAAMMRGMREKFLVDNEMKTADQAIRSLLIIDEFHNITRQENMDAIDLLDRYEREARKAFGGLGIATHDISDIFTDSASDSFKDKVRKLLKLSTYIFIMQQDPSSKVELKKSFSETLRESELSIVPHLRVGETILAIKGKGNIHMKIDLSEEERRLFTGGH